MAMMAVPAITHTLYGRVFVVGYAGLDLLRGYEGERLVPNLDLHVGSLRRAYKGQNLYVLVPEPKGAVRADGIGHQSPVDQFLAVEQLAGLTASMEDVKGMLAQLCDGVAGMAMGPPAAVNADRQPLGRQEADLKPESVKVLPDRPKATGNVFCRAGSHWDVTFDGGRTIHLRHTLGVEYLSYLLHHPGQPISAFDLETTIRPAKARARAKDSIQNNLDAEAVRDYLRQLDRLRTQRAEAAGEGDLVAVDRLDEDITAIENELIRSRRAPDAGERARSNVRKAIAAVQRKLRQGDGNEKKLGQHLDEFISLGYECCYHQPPGVPWA